MLRSGFDAYSAKMKFSESNNYNIPPVRTYHRNGKSLTDLGNGQYIEIAGEHEDYYDPDFCIYNEVFHHKAKGEFAIYMYPESDVSPQNIKINQSDG